MGESATDKLLTERIENDFTYHAPHGDQPHHYEHLCSLAKTLALAITQVCPEGRERSTALTRLEEAIFWTSAGIARHG
jgi:hypothetical protein